jgi:hypothetical protein
MNSAAPVVVKPTKAPASPQISLEFVNGDGPNRVDNSEWEHGNRLSARRPEVATILRRLPSETAPNGGWKMRRFTPRVPTIDDSTQRATI